MTSSTPSLSERPTARWLVLDGQGRVLLFRFDFRQGPLAGSVFWATPGGAVDPGETYEDAARRELFEETGLTIADPGPQVAQRVVSFKLPDGVVRRADQRFFLLRTETFDPVKTEWTAEESEVMTAHAWFTVDDIRACGETVWPSDLADMLLAL